jgi:hypothetical protein
MRKDLKDCKMNKHKRYCFEAEEKKFKKIIAHNYRIGARFNGAYALLSIYLLSFAKNTSESMR